MKITNLFIAFYLVESRSIFPKPRPTTLGYHPDNPNILIPVPLFPIGPATEDDTDLELSRENISETTTTFESTTFESTTLDLTTEKASLINEVTTTTSTAAPFYTTFFEELSEPLTAIIPSVQERPSSTIGPITSEIPDTTPSWSPTVVSSTTQSMPENGEESSLRDGFIAAWEMTKELGAMIIGGVGGMFSKITSFFN